MARHRMMITVDAIIDGGIAAIKRMETEQGKRAPSATNSSVVAELVRVNTINALVQTPERAGLSSDQGWCHGLQVLAMGPLMAGPQI
jgi:hypothetical protein